MNRLVEIDPETKLEAKPYSYEYRCYMFKDPPILQTTTTTVNENIKSLEVQGNKKDLYMESDQKPLLSKIEELIDQQKKDKFCSNIIYQLKKGWLIPEWPYFIKEGVLCRYVKEGNKLHPSMVIPRDMTPTLLIEAHNKMGHNGVGCTYALLKRYYYWKGIKTSMDKHVKNCYQCQKHNWHKMVYPKLHFDKASFPVEFLCMYLIGTLHPPSARGHQYALTAVCMLTVYVFCEPLKTKQAEEVVQTYIDNIYCKFRGSLKILTDNGTEFKNELFDKIHKVLGVIQDQNQQQDTQKAKSLANHLNLTMGQVSRHEEMLFELDIKMHIMNHTLHVIMRSLSEVHYENDLFDYIQLQINHMHSAMHALKDDIDTFYKYLHLLATQRLTPVTIMPNILCTMLHHVQEEIRSNAHLRLAEDPNTNVWAFYSIIKVTPVVMEDTLMLILTIPLIDQSLQMNLHWIHNLPMIHPELKIQAIYELEGDYFATLMEGMFVALPNPTDVKLCLMTQGHLCMFDQALYPVDRLNWCVYTLFINDKEKIKNNCVLKVTPCETNLAHSLDGYLWAISSLATKKLQIQCMFDVVTIKPPLQIIDVGNGCKALSSNIYIPAKSELTATLQSATRSMFFLDYNFLTGTKS